MAAAGSASAVLETERLVIRPWQLDEADRLYDFMQRMEVARWLSKPPRPMQDRDEAVERIERWAAVLDRDPRFGAWAVVVRASGVPAGTVLFKPLPDGEGEIEIGWHFHPDSWGHGFATESARAVLARGLAQGVDEVWAVTDLDNRASIGVCRRIGMHLLGITHRWYHEPSTMFWIGSRSDQVPSLEPDEPLHPDWPEGEAVR
jgi:RimJ/RimL family protein N-acetyltransferase